MIFVDSHVHIYDCFDVDLFLDAALNNFNKAAKQHNRTGQPSRYVLLLTEGANENWFKNALATLESADHERVATNWRIEKTDATDSLVVCRNDLPETTLYLVAGRQIVTKERIEVLALYTRQSISDGLSLVKTVDLVGQLGAIPVLPWGVGKWIGERGRIIQAFLSTHGTGKLYLGDNGGRPSAWPTPSLFAFADKKGVSVLPGSDVLPLSGEFSRVGSFGFYIDDSTSPGDDPVTCLKDVLLSQQTHIVPFGRLQKNSQFIGNQLRLRFSS